jgi:peptidoglycan biosynthesis protein MviN/MurJ (putative lipid II flippase)
MLTLVTRSLFAMERYRLVAALSGGSLALYIVTAAILRWILGIDGLAAAFSISLDATGIAACVLLVFVLELSPSQAIREWVALPLVLAMVFAAGAFGGRALVATSSPSAWQGLEVLLVSLLSGTAAFAGAISLLKTKEYLAIRRFLRRRPVRGAFADTEAPI